MSDRRGAAIATLLVSAVVLLGVLPANAQTPFWSRFIVRQNLDSKKDVPKPAFVEVTDPKDKPVVVGVGLGVTYVAIARPLLTLGPSLEYLRNTALDKPVHSTKLGGEVEWQMREVSLGGVSNSPILLGRAGYQRDEVKDIAGAEYVAYYTHLFSSAGAPNVAFGPSWLTLIYYPKIGIEFAHLASAASPGDEGSIARAMGQVDLATYPAGEALSNRIELMLSHAFRKDVRDTTSQSDDRHPMTSASATYYFVRETKRLFGIGVSYATGEDPSKGFAQQDYWQIGLRFQIKP